MSSILDINSGSSDSEDDQDYVPPNAAGSDESEEEISEEEYECSGGPTPKKIKLDEKEPTIDKEAADSIWKDFLKGVDSPSHNGTQKKAISSGLNLSHQSGTDYSNLNVSQSKTSDLKKSTCEMTIPEKEIISENVTEKETVSDDVSEEQKEITSEKSVPIDKSITLDNNSQKPKPVVADVQISIPKKGLSSILGVIGNKDKKMTVLEKSKLDWRNYKKEEGIEKDLETFNKGRQGYIERQRFLERSDLRLFETEKSARLSGRKK